MFAMLLEKQSFEKKINHRGQHVKILVVFEINMTFWSKLIYCVIIVVIIISDINFKTFLSKLALFQTQSSVQLLSPLIFVLLPKQWKQLIP